jgi:hypothetical protein
LPIFQGFSVCIRMGRKEAGLWRPVDRDNPSC